MAGRPHAIAPKAYGSRPRASDGSFFVLKNRLRPGHCRARGAAQEMCIRDSVIGVPVGLLTAVFLSKVASRRVASVVRPAVELLAGIPSVVYGLIGMIDVYKRQSCSCP